MERTAASTAPTEALAGVVERITFHNAETGFCVLRDPVHGPSCCGQERVGVGGQSRP